jgi:hypothetical protein
MLQCAPEFQVGSIQSVAVCLQRLTVGIEAGTQQLHSSSTMEYSTGNTAVDHDDN